MRIFNFVAMGLIRAYQLVISPWLARLGLRCRHLPSCSQYGIVAYAKHGFFKATRLTWQRYRDCHPASDRPYIDFP